MDSSLPSVRIQTCNCEKQNEKVTIFKHVNLVYDVLNKCIIPSDDV